MPNVRHNDSIINSLVILDIMHSVVDNCHGKKYFFCDEVEVLKVYLQIAINVPKIDDLMLLILYLQGWLPVSIET